MTQGGDKYPLIQILIINNDEDLSRLDNYNEFPEDTNVNQASF
jgi:hypothetical protein